MAPEDGAADERFVRTAPTLASIEDAITTVIWHPSETHRPLPPSSRQQAAASKAAALPPTGWWHALSGNASTIGT